MKLHEILNYLKLDSSKIKNIDIDGLNTLGDAKENEIAFLENSKYIEDLKTTKAAAVFIKDDFVSLIPQNTIAIVTNEPYLMLAYTTKLFAKDIIKKDGNEPLIGKNSTVMNNVYLGRDSVVGENCIIMSGVYIGDNVIIGNDTIIYPNVTIYSDSVIGNKCIIHAGTVIGSDGFGFAHTKDGKYIKIYHNGNVIIKDDVEIGSNTAIDRAVFKSTFIGNGVRIDNLVHIAHNCVIKDGVILVGQVGLSGSTTLHEYVVMGGQSGTTGHLEVAPFSTIAARGGVTKTIKEPKKMWAGFPIFEHRNWLKLQGKMARMLK